MEEPIFVQKCEQVTTEAKMAADLTSLGDSSKISKPHVDWARLQKKKSLQQHFT
jgi:hypothetical protein